MKEHHAPICLFTYNRFFETKQTIEALKENFLASESELFIFSDGPKDDQAALKVTAVRDYLKTVTGFKSIEIIESEQNNGLADSIINGVTEILKKRENVIVLEDDLLTSVSFLEYMNNALNYYQNYDNVQTINAYSQDIGVLSRDVYFHTRPFPWGWATWRKNWNPDLFDKKALRKIVADDKHVLKLFRRSCGEDISKMLIDSLDNKNNSWYVRWTFNHFMNKRVSVFPKVSLVKNIGFNGDGTHCKNVDTYKSIFSGKNVTIAFSPYYPLEKEQERQFLKYFTKLYKFMFRVKLLQNEEGRKLLVAEIRQKLSL